MKNENSYIRYPIGFELVLIISILVILSLGSITILVSYFVSTDVRVTAEDNNRIVNTRSAKAAESEISTIRSNVFLLLDMLNAAGSSGALSRQASAFFFERNQNIGAVIIPGDRNLINNRFFLSNEIDTSLINQFLEMNTEKIRRSEQGETFALNAASTFGLPVLVFMYPWKENGLDQTVAIFLSADNLTETFGTGSVNESFMVNDSGDLLIHPDFELVRSGVNLANHPLITEMRNNNDENRQIIYNDADEKQYFGAYYKLSIGDIGVLTQIEKESALEGVTATTVRNIWLTFAVLFISVLFIWLYSKSISNPLRNLTNASEEIEKGNYDIQLKGKSQDEIGVLTESFVKMSKGLAERERLKDTFGHFVNKDIAEKALKGELTLGGETKHATIFFSDIRSFTSISEKLEPFEVVEFLNDYMTRMVDCVNKTSGVVDKYIGDAIMAIWGAPVSAGSPELDALNCVRAALMMRQALIDFNKGRGGDKKPIIKIGCGINTGPVVAGQIGSSERMEYTCIGDAVNFASRTESLNKPLGTDILITENTYLLVQEHITVEQMPAVTVKGKEKPVKMYAVINMPEATDIPGAGKDGPKTLAQVREMLDIEAPDLGKVNLDAEEKKYKIKAE